MDAELLLPVTAGYFSSFGRTNNFFKSDVLLLSVCQQKTKIDHLMNLINLTLTLKLLVM